MLHHQEGPFHFVCLTSPTPMFLSSLICFGLFTPLLPTHAFSGVDKITPRQSVTGTHHDLKANAKLPASKTTIRKNASHLSPITIESETGQLLTRFTYRILNGSIICTPPADVVSGKSGIMDQRFGVTSRIAAPIAPRRSNRKASLASVQRVEFHPSVSAPRLSTKPVDSYMRLVSLPQESRWALGNRKLFGERPEREKVAVKQSQLEGSTQAVPSPPVEIAEAPIAPALPAQAPSVAPALLAQAPTVVPALPAVAPTLPAQSPVAPGISKNAQGEPLVTNIFAETDIKQALSDIADQTGVTIVADNTVQGTVSLDLKDVPLERALAIVSQTGGFAFVKMDGYYLVGMPDPNNPNFYLLSRTEIGTT